MTIIPDRDPAELANARARKRSRGNSLPLIGVFIAFILGFGLVSLFMRGPITGIATSPATQTGSPVQPIRPPVTTP